MKKRGARLGQHFLKAPWAARASARAANIASDETVLEIGPGKGALTEYLLQRNLKLWLCGHTHTTMSTIIGNTLLMTNPFGYHKQNHNCCFVDTLIH